MTMSFSLLLNLYGFWAFFSPDLFIVILLITGGYLYATRKRPDRPALVTTKRKILFVMGMVCLYMGFGGPLNILGHFLFSAHMLQMSFAFLAMPPLLLLGIPVPWIEKLLKPRFVKKTVSILTKPLFAVFLFNLLFSMYHLPDIFDAVMMNYGLHLLAHGILAITAFMMWWPAVCPVEDMDRLSGLTKILYMFANGILLTPACALIIFADVPLYRLYTEGAEMICLPFGYLSVDFTAANQISLLGMSIRDDQQAGGVVMKIAQEIIYGIVLGYNFFRWFRKEREQEKEWELDEAHGGMQGG